MRGIKNLSLGVAIKQDKDFDDKPASKKNEAKQKDYLMKEDNINEFIQESENEANDSEQDFSARNYAPLNKPP